MVEMEGKGEGDGWDSGESLLEANVTWTIPTPIAVLFASVAIGFSYYLALYAIFY